MTEPIPLDLTDLRPGVVWQLAGRNASIRRVELLDDGGDAGAYLPRRAELSAEVYFRRAPDSEYPAVDLGDGYGAGQVIKVSGGHAWLVASVRYDAQEGPSIRLIRVIGSDDRPAGGVDV